MPFQYDTFVYDYESFDGIKDVLDPNRFFTIMDKFLPGVESIYTDNDGYTYYEYLDQNDKDGYLASRDFVYKLNKDLFRDEHFSSLNQKNYNVVALGCSYTFGHGLPVEYTWPSILKNNISAISKKTKLFNLGSPGLGIDALINNLVVFINKYGDFINSIRIELSINRDYKIDIDSFEVKNIFNSIKIVVGDLVGK
jgi:hypothetical protein